MKKENEAKTGMRRLKFGAVPDFVPWNKCKAIRKFVRLTQTFVAEEMGVTFMTVHRLETGEDLRTSVKTRENIIAVFNKHLKPFGLFVEFDDVFPADMVGQNLHPRYRDFSAVPIVGFEPKVK